MQVVNFQDLGNNDRNYDFQTLNPWTPFDQCDTQNDENLQLTLEC